MLSQEEMLLEEGAPRRVPHYAASTVTHSAPEFANHEQDVIRQSFSTGNHTWMKEALPVELGPDAVNLLRRQRMERNRLAEPVPQTWSKMTQLRGGGYYPEFEYLPDEYDRRPVLERSHRQSSIQKRKEIASHDWRYASQERRMKHETMINDPRSKEMYPYLGGDKDAEIEASKVWGRFGSTRSSARGSSPDRGAPGEPSFLAGRGKGLEDNSRGSRMTMPTIVQRLQKRVDADWEGTTVVVSATDQDLIQIAFHMHTVDSERGVQAYMGVLSKDVDLLGNLGLRKVSQLWGMKKDFSAEMAGDAGEAASMESLEHVWMFFLLMPKWVRMRPTDAFYTTHPPRSQLSAFRMSTAGSSVMMSLGSTVFDPQSKDASSRLGAAKTAAPAGWENAPPKRGAPAPLSARGTPGGGAGGNRVDLSLIERAVSTLPAIQEKRGGSA